MVRRKDVVFMAGITIAAVAVFFVQRARVAGQMERASRDADAAAVPAPVPGGGRGGPAAAPAAASAPTPASRRSGPASGRGDEARDASSAAPTVTGGVPLDLRLEFPDGSPAPFLTLGAYAVESGPSTREAGAREALATADARGALRFEGLAAGTYRILDVDTAGDELARLATDAAGAVVVVRRRRLYLHVVDLDGAPRPDAVYAAATTGSVPTASWRRADDVRRPDGLVVLPYGEGGPLRFRARTATLSSGVLTLAVPGGRWSVEQTVVLREPDAPGALRPTAVDEAGRPIERFTVTARSLDPARWNAGEAWTFYAATDVASAQIEAGDYVLTWHLGTTLGGLPAAATGYGVERSFVSVAPGRTEDVRIVGRLGGRLRVRLRAKEDVASGLFTMSVVEATETPAEVAGRWLDADGRLHEAVRANAPVTFGWPLAPGRYRLVVDPGLAAPSTHPFTVTVGETTEVDVAIDASAPGR